MHSYALGRVSPNALLFGLTNQRSLKKDLKKKSMSVEKMHLNCIQFRPNKKNTSCNSVTHIGTQTQ